MKSIKPFPLQAKTLFFEYVFYQLNSLIKDKSKEYRKKLIELAKETDIKGFNCTCP